MAFSCGTAGFPRGGIASYRTARRHFDSVKPWQSKYNRDNERPIGSRSVKTDGYHFNKAMRELSDGSIAFRLYDTDCVVWHPDNTLTIRGYATMSTTAFISYLTPSGVHHRQGRKDEDEPVLQLHQQPKLEKFESVPYGDPGYEEAWAREWEVRRKWWNDALIIQCSKPVKLQCRNKIWAPVDVDDLEPFQTFRVERAGAREVSAKYQLRRFEELASLTLPSAMVREADPEASEVKRLNRAMAALLDGQLMEALRWCPRGTIRVRYRTYGTPEGVQPGFLRRLRTHVYDEEGVIERVDQTMLTPGQYTRYIADSKRFGMY